MKSSIGKMATGMLLSVCAITPVLGTGTASADTNPNTSSITDGIYGVVENNISDQNDALQAYNAMQQAALAAAASIPTATTTATSSSSATPTVVVTSATTTANNTTMATATATSTTSSTATATTSATSSQTVASVVTPPAADATTPTLLNLNTPALQCKVRSGDSHLQEWPAVIRTRIMAEFGVTDIGGYRNEAGSDHATGEALDVMVPLSSTEGDQIATWVLHNYKSLHIKYVIWKQHIWAPYRMYWRPMADRGSVTQNHYDHVHISFLAGSGTCPTN